MVFDLSQTFQPLKNKLQLLLFPIITLVVVPISDAADLAELNLLSLDALEAEQRKSPNDTSVKLALARKLGQSFQQRALDTLETITLIEEDSSTVLQVLALQCELNIRRGEVQTAAPICDQVEAEVEKPGLTNVSRAYAYNAIGYVNVRAGRAAAALRNFEFGLQEIGMDDEVTKVTLLHNRGVALMLSGLTEMAIEAFEAADLARVILPADDTLPSVLAYNLGYVQAQIGNHAEALKSYASTIPWIEETGQLARAYIAHTQVAISLNGLGRYQEALDELLPWQDRSDFNASTDSTAQAQLALAQSYLGLDNYPMAEEVLLKGIQIATQSNNPSRLRELSLAYGELLLNQNKPEAAANYLNALFEQVEQNDMRAGLGPAHQLLTEAYSALGNHQEALKHSQNAIEAYQTSQSDDFNRRLAALRVTNELDLKNQELALARERELSANAAQRLAQLVELSVIVGLLMMMLFVYSTMSRKASKKEAQTQREAASKLQVEVDARTLEVEQALEQKYASDKRKAELEIRVAKDDKLRLIGQLTGGVAHDFNNIMTVVQLCSELLVQKLEPSQKKLAQDILTAVNSGKAITRGLLAYARQQVLQPTTIEIERFIDANRSIFMRSIDASITFDTEIDNSAGPLIIEADPGQLTSTILNLVLNAKEASEANCKIILKASRSGDQVIISLIDQGRGMEPHELKTATEPFYSTKTMAEGTGLGLSMVEGFMKQSGGELRIESNPGVGTKIDLIFKVAAELSSTDNEETTPLPSEVNQTILLVEDEEQIRNIATLVLEQAGYDVTNATCAEDALQKRHALPKLDLLITDLVMPGDLSGKQLIDALREENAELPVLLISGYSADTPSGYPFLGKPFSMKSLLQKVRQLTLHPETPKFNSQL
ncbi:MAG: ATP-binding protein [Pseudohongiellaceae bacterium]